MSRAQTGSARQSAPAGIIIDKNKIPNQRQQGKRRHATRAIFGGGSAGGGLPVCRPQQRTGGFYSNGLYSKRFYPNFYSNGFYLDARYACHAVYVYGHRAGCDDGGEASGGMAAPPIRQPAADDTRTDHRQPGSVPDHTGSPVGQSHGVFAHRHGHAPFCCHSALCRSAEGGSRRAGAGGTGGENGRRVRFQDIRRRRVLCKVLY